MGEVYRADDLKLGQPVALKFLPTAVQRDQARLDRFLNEVKTALKVTHPNVCRVYDIGEVDGQHYISMEYVDGEDLSSLLRRIGRLPKDKAVQLARHLCAGLAAAHEEGILHRDLKPANVMIDGRGRAKITDFGLASLAEGIEGDEVRAGTPQYMSPEQHAGREVTVRSDIYSLGLVLYELFTGKRAFDGKTPAEIARLQEQSAPTSPSSHVEGLDQTVERIILRCLESDPGQRPTSVLAVAAALPGGDPLAAALAAGETPSPEMVAAAGPWGGIRPALAAACLAIVLIGIIIVAVGGPRTLYGRASITKSCDALEENARTIVRDLGHDDTPVDHVSWLEIGWEEHLYWAREGNSPADGSDPAARMVSFLYRQGPGPISPASLSGKVSRFDPAIVVPGELYLFMDVQGRMRYFESVPGQADFSEEQVPDVDWSIAFLAAGLRMEEFEPTEPRRNPPHFATERRAWTGVHPHKGGMPVRIEAAALNGKIVYFENVVPWDPYWSAETYSEGETIYGSAGFLFVVVLIAVIAVMAVAAVLLAFRHLRAGRSDRRGATRIAAVMGGAYLLHWLLAGHHVARLDELVLFIRAIGSAASLALLMWLFYVALEPYIRRQWPEAIISWSRLLAGRFRDPLVGRDVLIGFAAQATVGFLLGLLGLWISRLDIMPPLHNVQVAEGLMGGRFVVGQLPRAFLYIMPQALGSLLLLMLLRLVLRKLWLAVGALCLVSGLVSGLQFITVAGESKAAILMLLGLLIGTVLTLVPMILLVRIGFLSFFAFGFGWSLISYYPITVDTSAPYFGAGVFGALVVAALAIYAYRLSLTGRPVLREGDPLR